MIDNSTFSLTIENYEYVWKVKTLILASKKVKAIDWTIPDSFLLEWSWDKECIDDHIKRCLVADLNQPIIVWDGKVLDGCHRIVKALAMGQSEVKAKVIRDIPAPDEILDFNQSNYKTNIEHSFKDIIEIVKTKLNL